MLLYTVKQAKSKRENFQSHYVVNIEAEGPTKTLLFGTLQDPRPNFKVQCHETHKSYT